MLPQPPTQVEVHVKQVLPTHERVVTLIEKLNQYQIALYGRQACTLEPPEILEKNKAFMVGAFVNETLVGIGAVKILEGYAEAKRMYVEENYRGLSIAGKILQALEAHARQLQVKKIYLETGNQHFSALKLYKKLGYQEVEIFGDYKPNPVSVFLGKNL
ncbi:MAG: GNAT family N-acetyltransferase [Rufibacter sp.]